MTNNEIKIPKTLNKGAFYIKEGMNIYSSQCCYYSKNVNFSIRLASHTPKKYMQFFIIFLCRFSWRSIDYKQIVKVIDRNNRLDGEETWKHVNNAPVISALTLLVIGPSISSELINLLNHIFNFTEDSSPFEEAHVFLLFSAASFYFLSTYGFRDKDSEILSKYRKNLHIIIFGSMYAGRISGLIKEIYIVKKSPMVAFAIILIVIFFLGSLSSIL